MAFPEWSKRGEEVAETCTERDGVEWSSLPVCVDVVVHAGSNDDAVGECEAAPGRWMWTQVLASSSRAQQRRHGEYLHFISRDTWNR